MIKIKTGYINPSSSALEGFNIQRMVIHNKDISDGWWGEWRKLYVSLTGERTKLHGFSKSKRCMLWRCGSHWKTENQWMRNRHTGKT